MPRYRTTHYNHVRPGRRYRIVTRNRPLDLTVTVEGLLLRVDGNYAHFDRYGTSAAVRETEDWTVASIDEVHPDLPTTPGSVAIVPDKGAIVSRLESGRGEEPDGPAWFWVDSDEQVDWADRVLADVVYDAKVVLI